MLPLRFLLLVLSWLVLATQGLAVQSAAVQSAAVQSAAVQSAAVQSAAVQSAAVQSAAAAQSSRLKNEGSIADATWTTASGSQAHLDGLPPQRTAVVDGDTAERNLGSSPEPEQSRDVGTRWELSLHRVSVNTLSVGVGADRAQDRDGIVAQARAPPARVGFSS